MKFPFTLPSRKSLEFCMSHGRKYLLLCAHLCCILEKLLQYSPDEIEHLKYHTFVTDLVDYHT